MFNVSVIVMILLAVCAAPAAAEPSVVELKDLYFGEALYYAHLGDWFDAVSRLDGELAQHHGLDEPERDSLYHHLARAEFAVGDFELAYRMHRRAGRAITRVIEGNVSEPVRNKAIYRLARIYFQKEQPINALHAIDRIAGEVPEPIRLDIAFLRAQILLANGRFTEAARIFKELETVKNLEGFSAYNLGIALLKQGKEQEGRNYLDRTGRIVPADEAALSIRDKANLVLGSKLLEEGQYDPAKDVLERVRISGPFSNRALLGAGWADAFQGRFDRALVPWGILTTRGVTDASVQEGFLALPYAYGKLNVHSKAALLYGGALETFAQEIDKLGASITSIREGLFLKALVREELKQDANWVVKLRALPQTPETYYLLDLMASHDFQESLKNYLDMEALRKRLDIWDTDLAAYEEMIAVRRAYYQPLLPIIDAEFRHLDAKMRLRMAQRDEIQKRLKNLLVAPRPAYLVTSAERIYGERLTRLEAQLTAGGKTVSPDIAARVARLRGVLQWNLHTDYDRRLTEAYKRLQDLNTQVELLRKRYASFVRTRQAATQSYEGYEPVIRRQRTAILASGEKVSMLMARQGNLLENMAVNELIKRRDRLADFQIKARFAMADSYDRATQAQVLEKAEK
jgi:tetratricopeptide (TPR) repeat protein